MKISKFVPLLLLLPGCVFAVQNITATQTQPVRAVVSQNDINLISLKNDRIESLALPNSVIVEQNAKNGSAFLSFKSNAVVKGFLTTELGAKYQLEFVPSNIASETIVLIAPGVKSTDAVDAREYTQTLAQLLRAMYNDAELDGFARSPASKKLKINNMKLSLEVIYDGDAIEGQVLDFKNITDIAMTLKEVDFYTAGVRAVSIVDKTLPPENSTQVFIMRDKL